MVTKGERGGETDKLGDWVVYTTSSVVVYTTIYKIDNKNILYSTGNSTQYSVMT